MNPAKTTSKRLPLPDEQIISLYWDRNEQAIDETAFKYENYLYTVARHMLPNRSQCEECMNDTYLGAWNAMPPNRPNVLKAFLCTILRRLAIKRYHQNSRDHLELTVSLSELENFIPAEGGTEEDFDGVHLGQVLSGFVRGLSPRRRYIFLSRYYMADPIDTIAGQLGLSRSTVHKELAAIRQSLRETLEKEGYDL